MNGTGEDAWILEQFPPGFMGCAVELGAHDGTYLSNTLELERRGWTVLAIEPNPIHHAALKESRRLVSACAIAEESGPDRELFWSPTVVNHTLAGFSGDLGASSGMVPVLSLSDCLDRHGLTRLDCISLDVDGDEIAILRGANLERWNPRVIVVEDNGPDLIGFLEQQYGYRYVTRFDFNQCFVKDVA